MKELERTQNDYYKESKRLRQEVLELAEQLKNNPMRFTITNVITMNVYKPYAIIDEHTFLAGIEELRK